MGRLCHKIDDFCQYKYQNLVEFKLLIMGEAKRRQTAMGENGQDTRILPWVPITKTQAELFVTLTTRGAWIGIGIMVAGWATIRFIGPAFGWWQVVG
jgi:hypothetical protein